MMSIQDLEEKIDASMITIKNAVLELKKNTMDIATKQIDCIKKTEILHNKDLEICERERKLIELEREYNERLEQLIIKEKAIEKEQEDGRKVSILKNIQIQLSQKTSECELLSKQLKLYKSRYELLNNLCNKYNINIAALQFLIEKTIIMQNMSLDIETPVVEIPKVEIPKVEIPKVEIPVPEIPKVETPKVEIPKVEIPKVEIPVPEIPKVEIPVPETNVNNNDNENLGETAEEPIEEGIEVDIFNYKGKQYYIDNNSGDIYAKLEDDEVGDIIGYKNEKGIVKFGLRKK
jgi:hypothetical protein